MTTRETVSLTAQRVTSRRESRAAHLGLQVDFDGRILRSRPGAADACGLRTSEVIGEYASDLFVADDVLSARALLHRAARGDAASPILLRLRRVDGEEVVVRVSACAMNDTVNMRICEGDATERAGFVAGSAERARLDPLTGLPNRLLLSEHADAAIKSCTQTLALIDVDRFRHFVSALGTRFTDRILVEIADRLVAAIGPSGFVGWSSGQFAVIVPIRPTSAAIASLIARIRAAIGEPLVARGEAIELSACLGIATSTVDAESLFSDAEVALAQAKSMGPAHDVIFDPAFRLRAVRRLELQGELSRAISDQELRLYYQPIVALEDDTVVAYEALVRWQHPVRGKLEPCDFLGIAQASGAGAAIDDWVLTEACRQGSSWARAGSPTTVCVNVTPDRFAVPGFAHHVERALTDSGFDPELLMIEITECNTLGDIGAARDTLESLKELGVRVALDDYGTGYSSLADVAALQVDELKIDISFVAGLGSDRALTAIVHAIVGLGHALGIPVVAEGVETTAQAFALRALGCEFGQGFLFGHPSGVPARLQRTT